MEPLYGQKDLAEFCEFVIASLFEIAPQASTPSGNTAGTSAPSSTSTLQQTYGREGIDTPPYTPPLDGNPARNNSKEPPALLEFIAYALYRTRLPTCIVNQSLLLLSRLKQRYPSARGTSSSPHRLFLSSLMLSAKISMDDTYSNKSWAIVGSSFFPLREVNQMERELFAFLGWNVVASNEELESFTTSAQNSFKQHKDVKRAERVKRRRLEEDEARESRHRQATNAARALLRPHTYRHQQQQQGQGGHASPSPSHSRSPSRSSSSASYPYTPISNTASMQASPIASTSSAVASPALGGSGSDSSSSSCNDIASGSSSMPSSAYQSRATSPSSIAMAAATAPASASRTAAHQHHHFHHGHYTPSTECSLTSSAVSSAFPSASHSPTSPASEPLSAGPQTPDTDCHHLHHQQHQHHGVSADFPEADSYLSKGQGQWHQHPFKATARGISPPSSAIRRSYHSATSPDNLANALVQQLQQVQA